MIFFYKGFNSGHCMTPQRQWLTYTLCSDQNYEIYVRAECVQCPDALQKCCQANIVVTINGMISLSLEYSSQSKGLDFDIKPWY